MSKNKSLYITVAVILVCVLVFLAIYLLDGISLSFVTYAKWEQDGYSFVLKGSSGEINKIKIKKDGKRLGSFDFSGNGRSFDAEGSPSAIFLENNADTDLILVPCAFDTDGDEHYRLVTVPADGSITVNQEAAFSNPTLDAESGYLVTEEAGKEDIGEPIEDLGAPYREYAKRGAYKIEADGVTKIYEISITYHSETDIYCFSERVFDEASGELGDFDDSWLLPDEYAEKKESVASLFTVKIPD